MNTRNTTQQPEKKFQQAIEVLEILQRPQTFAILGYLQEYGRATFIDMLIHFQDMTDLEGELKKMSETGILKQEEIYYSTYYRINQEKLIRVFRVTNGLPQNAPTTMVGIR